MSLTKGNLKETKGEMKNILKQLSQITDFEFVSLLDYSNDLYFLHHITKNNNEANDFTIDILEFIKNTKLPENKSLFIPSITDFLKEYSDSILYNSKLFFKSVFLYSFDAYHLNQIICLAGTRSYNLDKKDLLLINSLCENYFLKQTLKNKEPKQKTESKELFQIIFNSVPEAISFHELPDHKTIMVNKAFEEYTGYSQDDVLNKTGNELELWANDNDRLRYRNELYEKGYIYNFKSKFRLKGGKIGIGLLSGKIVLFKDKPHFLLIIRDISQQQEIQNKLIASEEKFRNLFNSLPDPVSINKLDDTMGFTNVNKAFEKLTHRKESELIGKSGFELHLWDDKNQRDTYTNHIKKHGEIRNFQARIKLKNGNTEEGLISAKTLDINKEPHLLVILKSIDSLIKLKQNLQISEKKFRSIFDFSPDAININKLANSEFVDINRSFTQITGYNKKELIGKSIDEFDFWYSREDADYYTNKLTQKGSINNFETRVRLKNGRIIHVLISAITIKISGVPHIVHLSRNIEDIKSIERGLKESESRFRTIVEKSHAAILIIDENQKFIYVNPKAQFLFKYSIEELIGMNFEKLLHPDSIEIVKERYKKRQQGENVPEQYEFKILQKNGSIREVEISSSIYEDKNGKTRSISQLLDITERNRAFANLKKEQIKAQNYLDIAAFMIVSINESGTIQLVNQKTCDILGYSEAELIGNNWFELCLPKSIRDYTKKRVETLFANKKMSVHSEYIIETKDGKERTINWHSTILFNEEGKPVELLSAGEDITDKVNSLRIINQTKTVAIIWKYNKGSVIHPISYVSENIEKLLGYTHAEMISNKIKYIDIIHPNDLNKVLSEVEDHIHKDRLSQYTHDYYRLKTKKGNWIWVEDQTEFITNAKGEITHLSGILIDVSERKRNLELIKSSEERYKTVFFANLDGLVIFNEDGKIVEVNQVLCDMYGYSKDQLISRKDHTDINIGSDLDLPYVKKQLQNQDSISSESVETRKDGTRFYVSSKLRWINYNNENHILAIFRNISDKKANEMELLMAKEKAEESDRLKSSFLANMSHEIRTPMNAIIGFSSLLEEPDMDDEDKASFVSRIKNNSKQLLRLINDIIDISKIEANQVNLVYNKIQMNLFLQSIYELFELEAKNKRIKLSYECHDLEKMNHFKSDNNRLTQIITNLMSNALKFTPVGGSVIFGSYPSPSTEEVILYVKDTGIGIPIDAQKHIFQRFRQVHEMTHTDYGGTGLGLSIVKGLVDSMNGRIWLESKKSIGSQFYIALPYSEKK